MEDSRVSVGRMAEFLIWLPRLDVHHQIQPPGLCLKLRGDWVLHPALVLVQVYREALGLYKPFPCNSRVVGRSTRLVVDPSCVPARVFKRLMVLFPRGVSIAF